jgi:hypothetical protein
MSLKTYTVNVNGNSNGNTITSPFTIEVNRMEYDSVDNELRIHLCTKNGTQCCPNDDIDGVKTYAVPSMSSSKNLDLTNALEADLDTIYGSGNWS